MLASIRRTLHTMTNNLITSFTVLALFVSLNSSCQVSESVKYQNTQEHNSRYEIKQIMNEIGDSSVEIITSLIDNVLADTMKLSSSKRHDLPFPNYFMTKEFVIYETSDWGINSTLTFLSLDKKVKFRELQGIISVDENAAKNHWDSSNQVLLFYNNGSKKQGVYPFLSKHDFKTNMTEKLYDFQYYFGFEKPVITTDKDNRVVTVENKKIKY